jgi:hypothetical protein
VIAALGLTPLGPWTATELLLATRNLLQPFSNTQGDLSTLGRDAAHSIGPKPDRLVVGESRRVQDTGSGEVLGERLEQDARRQSRCSTEHLDQS